ncbi:MAG: chromosome segregation protein SMC [Candidatus Thermoplasmatota archaeon]|jgi:chromosome segregation protein|nr:chromosome segregation protein SMC [Candidatus Thermoplasmatota archaeon]
MFLKRIEMENFKSFGRKTVVDFRSGYTSVTGPNASGKSNIGDALLFVLGTKSNKSLRAQKLTDLIHRNQSGKPSPYLKASVTFDNKDRLVPLDANEVTFTRMVKLSENNDQDYSSYYYINEDRARLQDFEYLLEKVKIFADGYNFVRQGDITGIVEMTPLERRGILEEVGGISVYNTEIEKANNEKEKTRENMVTVQALVAELSGRVELLTKEKEQAEAYLSKKGEIERDESIILFRKKSDTESEITTIKEQIEKINSEINATDEKVKELVAKGDELDKRISSLQESNKELEEFQRIKADLDSSKINYAKVNMEHENLLGTISQIKKEISDLTSRKKKLENEVKQNETKVKSLEEDLKSKNDELKELELNIQDLENKSATSVDKFEDLAKTINEINRQKEDTLNELAKHKSNLSSIQARNTGIMEEMSKVEEELATLEFSIKDADWRSKNLKKTSPQGEDFNKLYLETKKRIDQLRKDEEDITTQIEKAESEVGKVQGVKLSGVWESINFINTESANGNLKGIRGTVDSLISYSPENEKAVRAAAGNRLFSIVVEKDEDAQAAIESLKRKGKGRLTFLPLNKIIPLRPRGKAVMLAQDKSTLGFLSEKVTAEDSLKDIISYVFSDTLLVRDMKVAREVMGGVRIVTLDGDLIDPSNAMTGGTLPKREIAKDLDGLTAKLSSLKGRRVEIRNELGLLENELRGLAEKINKAHLEVGKSEGEYNQMVSRKKELEEQLRKKKAYLDERKKLLEIGHNDEMAENAAIEQINSELESINAKIEKINAEKDKAMDKKTREEIRAMKQRLGELKNEVEERVTNLNNQKMTLSGLKANLDSVEESIELKQDELSNGKKTSDEMEASMQKIKGELDALTSLYQSKEGKLKKRGEEIEKITNERFKVRSEIDSKTTIKKTKMDFLLSLQAKMEDATQRISELSKEIEEKKYEIIEDHRSVEEIKKEINILENQLREMEPINLKSINDYAEEKGRLDELLGKKLRLEEEMSRLGELESKLEEQKKVVFLEVFEAVNKNFIGIYKELTNGGEGYLMLENVTNPFQGGLVIKASSKGKKVDNLASLSGGEKSIAALSFIIAIQNYDPSPIYFMDEVDMFLDGVNAENVGRLFRRNSESAQIIAVTLRKATMKYAHQIIGVTFQDKNSTVFTKELEPEEAVAT